MARELIFQNERTRVFRLHVPGRRESVVYKERLGADGVARTRNERRVLERLAGIDGVPGLAAASPAGATIALADHDGVRLTDALPPPLAAPALLDLATRLTLIVAAIHRRGVVHKDINPGNILICGAERRPLLTDFDLATTFAEDRPAFVHHREIAGTLAYIAPEQTGRTGRGVDYRADLYALGATLYELATGRPPFVAQDPLQLIHDHLARLPVPPSELAPALPAELSAIILRLLEKEPDRRYQSAEGLAHDLARLRDRLAKGERSRFVPGERDFPLRLSPPSKLFGRDQEIAALHRALADADAGRSRGLLVAGAPGVGKTALIDELRAAVTARRGWFLAGKFDQYRHDSAAGAVAQVLRALGRMLLAEPETGLVDERRRIHDALGSQAGLITAALPEFAILIGTPPAAASCDPAEAQVQLQLASLALLRVVAATRLLVVVLDDLQWADPAALRLIDAVLTDERLSGVLLVGAYREADVGTTHALSVMLARWQRLGVAPPVLRLANLAPADLAGLLAEMLRLSMPVAEQLAQALGARTAGNPFDTVELVNALRRDGVLLPGAEGWSWDEAAIRRYVGRGEVVDLLASRIARLPPATRRLMQTMACLGGEVEISLLQAASGLPPGAVEAGLAPALEDGLLVMAVAGEQASLQCPQLRFRHDRVQQAVHDGLRPERRRALHLAAARRLMLAPKGQAYAAAQYLAAVTAVRDPQEQRRVVELFHAAAAHARTIANYELVERLLAAAVTLLDASAAPDEDPLRAAIDKERHTALCSLGRHAEADAVHAAIARRCSDPVELADVACTQVNSLLSRGRAGDAVAFGLAQLRRLGLAAPDDGGAELPERLHQLYELAAPAGAGDDPRPAVTDARILAMAKLVARISFPALLVNPSIRAWLVLESCRLWAAHGPCAPLLYNLASASFLTIAARQDYRTGYEIARRVLAIGEARELEPELSRARLGFGLFSAHWFEPLEHNLDHAARAREGLLHAGDLHFVGLTYYVSVAALLDCAATLDEYEAEVEAALAFALRTGNERAVASFLPYRQLCRALRGDTAVAGSLSDASFDEATHIQSVAANLSTVGTFHVLAALAAALLQDAPRLDHHSAEAMRLRSHMTGLYRYALIHLLRALAAAGTARQAAADARRQALSELAACRDWLAARAADAPQNFSHLLRLVEAEEAWTVGSHWAAVRAFDAALSEAEEHQRPWHRALIAERAARFHLAQGLSAAGRQLMIQSHGLYAAWGATAKLRQIEHEHQFVSGKPAAGDRTLRVSSDAIDLMAVLRASQALSSETSLARLKARIVELLGAMTGATDVQVVLWRNDPPGWSVSGQNGDITLEEAGARGLVPLAALSYAARTREPLLVDDASRDERFAKDAYVAGLDGCSLLIVPILSHGEPRAMLLLENRLGRGAFTIERLEAVTLIAGQLAVSFDNALLYASLERKVVERTRALEEANGRLETLSITDPLTGLANRRRFAEVLEAEWTRARAGGDVIALALIDVDHFKLYNDRYGHVAGDACLRLVASALSDGVRGSDLLARYGGEEFAVILPGADRRAVRQVAERLRTLVAARREPHAGTPAGAVTISVGAAAVSPGPHLSAEQLIEAADAALYEAKRSGRNRVRIGTAEPGQAPMPLPAPAGSASG
jgi:diguanylate cyclase (GGDEF)-like protein